MTYLLLDSSYLFYRAFYAMGDLSFGGVKNGGVYGFFRELVTLQERWQTNRFVFCFDVGRSKRRDMNSDYKANRKEWETDEECKVHEEIYNQLTCLREKYLPYMGYRNIVWQKGYEADDLIAAICRFPTLGHKSEDTAIIVSADADLFQILDNPRVSIWNPQKKELLDGDSFREKWGISPSSWASVKAIAGCTSDNIRGIERVGEKTAVKFLSGTLNPDTKAHRNIVLGRKIWSENLNLTQLPLDGTKQWRFVEDKTSDERWNKAMGKLGMKSLIRGRVKGVRK